MANRSARRLASRLMGAWLTNAGSAPADCYYTLGMLVTSSAPANAAPSVDTLYTCPFAFPLGVRIDRIGFYVQTLSGSAGAKARCGLYSALAGRSNLSPGRLLLTGDEHNVSTTGGSTGAKETTCNLWLRSNTLYHWWWICGTGAPTIKTAPSQGLPPVYGSSSTFGTHRTHLQLSMAYALPPDPWTGSPTVGSTANTVPLVYVRVAEVKPG